eukprot:CAMPEP_0170599500 /NCGR_PEP_ID=MMETSP0224-20130122/16829_1 /TAXON_ID=285029 /ORGANISM="Togula jolla, Strain CCCM 725" /LENGTH=390 /DNA_ID=CAMNT_0010924153 /DNA_START=27 /DNA_END=1199 /DNA_ORIENTATION=+
MANSHNRATGERVLPALAVLALLHYVGTFGWSFVSGQRQSTTMTIGQSSRLGSQPALELPIDEPSSYSMASSGLFLGSIALAGAAIATRARHAQRDGLSRGLVAAKDGSSWGSMNGDASSSLITTDTLPYVKLVRGADEAKVYLLGACVTSYKTDGTEWLAVRPDAKMDGSKPISGGLPHCFPQFGPGEIQQHGFARNLTWHLLEEPSEGGTCVLELRDCEETRAMWPHNFRCEYRVELQDGQLNTSLKVENTSGSDFTFTAALHSYYSVSDINTCKISGDFEDATKIDKTEDPPKMGKGSSNTIEISKFTEEIYKEILPGKVVLADPAKGELEIVSGGGWRDVVVWNPYGDKGMGADNFVCVESAELAQVKVVSKGVWEGTMNLVPKKK